MNPGGGPRSSRGDGHPQASDPHAVRRRQGQLLRARGSAADPGRHRAEPGKSLDELQHQLEGLGHAIEDLELIVITHQHIDHLPGRHPRVALRRRGGGDRRRRALRRELRADTERDDLFAAGLMLRYGIPEDLAVALRSVSASFRGWGRRRRSLGPLADGEALELRDRTLEVQRPGHSPPTRCSGTPSWSRSARTT